LLTPTITTAKATTTAPMVCYIGLSLFKGSLMHALCAPKRALKRARQQQQQKQHTQQHSKTK
jgi:hypothetical protein